ncbi:MAG: hypothetical protein WCG47_23075 [Dermatophilaceae bacterium]
MATVVAKMLNMLTPDGDEHHPGGG